MNFESFNQMVLPEDKKKLSRHDNLMFISYEGKNWIIIPKPL